MEVNRNLGADNKDFSEPHGKNKMNDDVIYGMGNRNHGKNKKDNKRILGTDNKHYSGIHGRHNIQNKNRTYSKMSKEKERTFVKNSETIHEKKEDDKSNRLPLVNGKHNNSDQDKDNKNNTRAQDNDKNRIHNRNNKVSQKTSSKSLLSKEKVSRTNSFHTRNVVDSDSDITSVTHDGPNVNNLRPVMEKNGPNINDTNIRNDNSNIDDTNIPKNGRPPFTVKFSVLVAVILILALFILPCCLYKAKSLNMLSRRNKLASSENCQSTISQISTGVLSWQPREAMSEVYVL